MRAHGVSLWLVPEGPEALAVDALIGELACRFGTPHFAPHLTLVAGIETGAEAVVRGAHALAQRLPVTPVRFLGLAHTPDYFRALFARAAEDLPIANARRQAEDLLGPAPPGAFAPHLSLLYGRIPHETLRLLVDEFRAASPPSIVMRALEVVSTEGEVHEWRSLARLPLVHASQPLRVPTDR
jgi:cyclic phosphodiesterase-like protein